MKLNGKIYDGCVQRVLVYGIKMWAMNAEDLNRLRKVEGTKDVHADLRSVVK